MSRQASLFARKLRAYRTQAGAHGRLTQEALADRLGVSCEAVGKYERSLSYIRGDLEHRLVDRLGWNRTEVEACRQDWDSFRVNPAQTYRALSQEEVTEVFGNWTQAAHAVTQLVDEELRSSFSEGFNTDDSIWVPIIAAYPSHGGFITKGETLVGHWGMQFLADTDRDSLRARTFVESHLTTDCLRRPILPGHYYGYCPVVVIARGHEGAAPCLLSSFVSFLEGLAEREVFVDGIGAAAISAEGRQFCQDVGMTRIGAHRTVPGVELWELPGSGVARSFFARKSPRLRSAYAAEFG